MGNSVNNNSNVVNFNDLLNKPTVPTNNNQLTNGAGFIDGSALNASNLSSGTVPDARFPATLPAASATNLTSIPAANITGTLPAISGANLTNLDADDLASGTIPDARFPATLPAVSGANLTNLPSGGSGTTGGGSDELFLETDQNMTQDYQLTANKNALTISPVINNGVTLTVPSGAILVIL